MVSEKSNHSVSVEVIDHTAHVLYVLAVSPELTNILPEEWDESFVDGVVHEHIIWCNACLSCIHVSPPDDLLSSEV